MKIQVCGYSGSGKSTFSRKLGEYFQIPVLHLDTIHFKDNWQVVSDEEMNQKAIDFTKKDTWIIDGNYHKIALNRFSECDQIFYFNFNRFICLRNAYRRYKKYLKTTRPDMAPNCAETLDWEFISWILYRGRTKKRKQFFKDLQKKYPDKFIIFKNHKEVDQYLKQIYDKKI